jgi:hypothetical protein
MNTSTEKVPALICIPDITGFTRFMVENEIEFSKQIIPPLLRDIVSSNTLNFEVGEIEGDAVVFYRFGTLPTLKELVDQCKSFYFNFNEQLKSLMDKYADNFQKNVSSDRLSLKIIIHAAEMASLPIAGKTKLIGEDVVLIHKLLKNSVTSPDYILITEKLLSNYTPADITAVLDSEQVKSGKDEYEFIGFVNYRYIILDPSLKTAFEQGNT